MQEEINALTRSVGGAKIQVSAGQPAQEELITLTGENESSAAQNASRAQERTNVGKLVLGFALFAAILSAWFVCCTAARARKVRKAESLAREAEELERCRGYAGLMSDMAMPLQQFLGLAKLPIGSDWKSAEGHLEILRGNICGELERVMRRHGAQYREADGVLVLPTPETANPDGAEELNLKRPERAIRNCEKRIERARIWDTQRKAAQALSAPCRKIQELSGMTSYDSRKVEEVAAAVRMSMESENLFPMFFHDSRLSDYPELRASFLLVTERALPCPGLFLRREDNTYVQYGSFSGRYWKDGV